ncbi:hypothetical protein BC826DRAFT_22205 [Russula brevipes]|nr:hypothetical protein BC826DRAFT_312242 [Russula brevipes]KAI0304892.1 hypothetical protein BC826DRAFT_22205 [Russula brevipes]
MRPRKTKNRRGLTPLNLAKPTKTERPYTKESNNPPSNKPRRQQYHCRQRHPNRARIHPAGHAPMQAEEIPSKAPLTTADCIAALTTRGAPVPHPEARQMNQRRPTADGTTTTRIKRSNMHIRLKVRIRAINNRLPTDKNQQPRLNESKQTQNLSRAPNTQ